MNRNIKFLMAMILAISVISVRAMDTAQRVQSLLGLQTTYVRPKQTLMTNVRDGALGLGAAYMLRSKLSASSCLNGAAAIVVGNSFMPNFVRRSLHQIPVLNRLVYSGEEQVFNNNIPSFVSYKRELMDMTALGATVALATLTGRSPFSWNALCSIALLVPIAQNFTPASVRQALADIPLLRKIVGAREVEYNHGFAHRAMRWFWQANNRLLVPVASSR